MDPQTHLRIDPAQHPGPRAPVTCVGEWELLTAIGGGNWSTVYAARPRGCAATMPVDYAVKVAATGPSPAAGLLAREVTVAARVTHRHLIAVLSADVDAPEPFLVMPLLRGANLRDVLTRCGPLVTPQALWIARQVAGALAALHAAGWLHADVKPGNIHVSSVGHATLIDLGLALQLRSDQCGRDAPFHGTAAYAAPEMISRAREVGAPADTYSLGATLYELVTGRPPFPDADIDCVMAAHLERALPNPRHLRPQLDQGTSRLLRDMLAKEPLRRPADDELVERLVELEIATLWERAA